MRYERHIFVCVNEREPGHPRGCCREKGGEEVRSRFKAALKERRLHGRMRANVSGCLDACEFGVSAVVYPDGVWYGGITVDDVEEIVESHMVNGIPVDRLRIQDRRYTPVELLLPDRTAGSGGAGSGGAGDGGTAERDGDAPASGADRS